MAAQYFTGDDWTINVTLKKNGVVYDVSAATIKAAVVQVVGNTNNILISATTQSSETTGADWANGLVVVKFAAANTGITVFDKVKLEIQVELAGEKETWPRSDMTIKRGAIA